MAGAQFCAWLPLMAWELLDLLVLLDFKFTDWINVFIHEGVVHEYIEFTFLLQYYSLFHSDW